MEVLSAKMMSSFAIVSSFAKAAAKLYYELSLEIQKYRLLCGRIYEIMEKVWELLPTAYKSGRIFGHMRFEALKSRSSPVVDAYSS